MNKENLSLKVFTHDNIQSLLITSKEVSQIDILLNGHLDVVAASKDQFSPVIRGDRLYGRGSLDMKGSLAVLIILAKECLKDTSNGLLISTDEEVGGKNGCGYLVESKQINCRYFITGEPTQLRLAVEEKGVIWLKIKLKGRSAHASTPWLGDNPILKINNLMDAIYKRYPLPKKDEWKTTIIPNSIESDNSQNQIPEEIWIKCDCRYIPDDNPKDIIDLIKGLSDDVEIQLIEPPLNKINHSYTRRLEQSTKGKNIKIHFASDARFFSASGTPSVVLGPKGENMHGKNEWVSIQSLLDYYEILKDFIKG